MMLEKLLSARRHLLPPLLLLAAALSPAAAHAATSIAVAANFTDPAKQLAATFEQQTGDTLALSFGSSGQILAQITQGAPYEVFLSADAARPKKLAGMGLADPASLFTYAVGKLVLWSATQGVVDSKGAVLSGGRFAHIAIANPVAAPYGAAGIQTLQALGLYAALTPKIVTGENISQTYQFVASGNAELGFVALSQIIQRKGGSQWLVPQKLYAPILQDAVLLKPGESDAVAKAFLAYLQTPPARAIIRSYGYDTVP